MEIQLEILTSGVYADFSSTPKVKTVYYNSGDRVKYTNEQYVSFLLSKKLAKRVPEKITTPKTTTKATRKSVKGD